MLVGAARDDQHGHGVGVGLGEAAERVLDARPGLDDDHRRLLAIGGARVAVGHVDQRLLAASDDRPNADLGGRVDQRVVRIREQDFDALEFQNPRQSVRASHRSQPPEIVWSQHTPAARSAPRGNLTDG